MSQGKYSPCLPTHMKGFEYFDRNADGDIPPNYDPTKDTYDERVHFGDYDPEGFDRYGYSAFDASGAFVGLGNGVDRLGHTEMEYLEMSVDEFYDCH